MHPMILGLFDRPSSAAAAARALHAAGISRDQISVVSRNHDEEGALAHQMDATPGAVSYTHLTLPTIYSV